MTITHRADARPNTAYPSPFRLGAGTPSLRRIYSPCELLGFEELLVAALRGYAAAVAEHSRRDDPFAYAARVADLTTPEAGDSPTVWTSRLPALLHQYADHIPSAECEFVGVTPGDHPCWEDAQGRVVVDVLTTLTMTELAPGESEHQVHAVSRATRHLFGDRFFGVRHIVLDAPYEGSWCPADGDPEPLFLCDLDDAAVRGGFA